MDGEEKMVFDQIKDAGNLGTSKLERRTLNCALKDAFAHFVASIARRNLDKDNHNKDRSAEDDDYQGAQGARGKEDGQDGQVGQGERARARSGATRRKRTQLLTIHAPLAGTDAQDLHAR